MDLGNPPMFTTFFTKFNNNNNKIHCTYSTAPAVKVFLIFPGVQAFSVEAQTSADLYDVLRYLMLTNTDFNKMFSVDNLASRFTLYFGFKPLSRKHIVLSEYNIKCDDVIKIAYNGILGGAHTYPSLQQVCLPTYEIIAQTERDVLANFNLQSVESDFDISEPRSVELLNAVFGSGIFQSEAAQALNVQWLHHLLRDVLYMLHDVSRAKTNHERFGYVKYFIRQRMPNETARFLMEAFLSDIRERFFGDDELEVQSFEKLYTFASEKLSSFEELKKAPFFKKLYQIGLFVLSHSIFSKFGITFDLFKYSAMEAAAIKERFHMGPNLLLSLIKSLMFIGERGYQCYMAGSIEPLYHSGSQYEKWYEQAMEIKRKSKLLHCPEAHGFSLFEFLADARDVIEKGQSIAKHATRIGASEKRMVSAVLSELLMILADNTTKREAQKERTAPFCICLYGGSSIGKTTITDMLFFQYGKVFNLPIESEFKYTRNPNAKYWDGFNTSQWFVIMDDIAYMHPNIATAGDPSLMETIQTNNRVAFVPDQAALEDKGRTPFKARCVVATTNCEDMNAIHYFQTPLAMQRRFPFTIDVKVKEEFAKDACMLDSSKTKLIDGQWPSYWTFTIKRPRPDGEERRGQRAKLEEVCVYDDVNDFLAWFSREAVEHERVQKLVEASSNNMKNVQVCDTCYRNTKCCTCLEIQSGVMVTARTTLKRCGFHGLIAVLQSDLLPKLLHLLVTQPKIVAELEQMCLGDATITQEDIIPHLDLTSEDALEQAENFCMHGEDFDAPSPITMGMRFRELGDAVLATLGNPEFYGLLVAATGMLLGAYKLYKTLSPTKKPVEKQATEEGQKPIRTGDEKPNVWFQDTYELSSFDVTATSQCMKGYSPERILNFLQKNIVALRAEYVRDGDVYAKRFRATCLGGHVYITNLHNLPEQDCDLYIISAKVDTGVGKNTKMKLSRELIWSDKANDLCAFTIECLPPRKDISQLFTSVRNFATLKGRIIQRNDRGEVEVNEVHNYRHAKQFTVTSDFNLEDAWTGYPQKVTQVGECGALHVAETPMGPQILGMHVAGNDKMCVSTLVSFDKVQEIHEFFVRPTIRGGEPVLSSESAERELGDLHKKSPLRWIVGGVAAAYGSYVGWRNTPKSTVKATFIQDAVLEEGIEIKHGAPVMASYEPWRIAALDMVNPVTDLDLAVLKKCKESFLRDILSGISKEALSQVHVYDDKTTLNGAPGVAFVDKMNRNTSMGAPWRTGKKHFLLDLPADEEYSNAVAFTPEVMARVRDCIAKYEDGERYMPVFTGQLKDEALAFRKIAAKKTRVFAAAPADWSFVVRKYLLSVIRLIQTNKYVFETAVGTNAASTQWEEMRAYLVQHGEDNMIAGDYGRFDKTMPPCIILAAFDIIREICRAAGYTPKQLKVVQGIAEDTAFPLIDFNGDLIEFYGSNPSGHPLTVIINSLANSLYMRYCYTMLSPERSCVHFKRDVALMTYGDDNAMGVRKGMSFFNHTAIQKTLAECGITYTMADKEAASIPYIHIDEISFLKRLWRYDEEVGAYLAPLEMDSITKSLTVNTESKSLCPEAHSVAVMSSAHCEFFFHGRAEFERGSAMLQRIVKKKNLQVYVKDNSFPTWLELKERFWANSA